VSKKILVLLLVLVTVGAFAVAGAVPECVGQSNGNSAGCDLDGDGIPNGEEAEGCRQDPDPECGGGGGEPPPPPPEEDPLAPLCEAVPDLPICGGGGEPPSPDDVVAAVCDAIPDLPVCGGGDPPPDLAATLCEVLAQVAAAVNEAAGQEILPSECPV